MKNSALSLGSWMWRDVFEDDDDWLFRVDVTAAKQLFETLPVDLEAE